MRYKNKEEYLAALAAGLKSLTKADRDDALLFYEEYLSEAGEENFVAAAEKLGNPREIALLIRQDKIFEDIQTSPPSAKKGLRAVWLVVLAVLAAPFALPVAVMAAGAALMVTMAVAAVVFMFVAGLAMLVLMLGAVALGLLVMGLAMLCLSVPAFFQHFVTGIMIIGVALLALGVGALVGIAAFYAGKWFVLFTKKLFGRWLPAVFRRVLRIRRAAV